jgi:hypothetical protein
MITLSANRTGCRTRARAVHAEASTLLGSSRLASIIGGCRGSLRRKFGRAGLSGWPSGAVTAWRRWFVIVCLGALGVTGCGGSGGGGGGGGGSGSLKLGQAASLARPGNSTTSFKEYKYKAAVVSVTRAGPNDLKNETILGAAPKDDVAVYVTQRVTGVQPSYSGWSPEPPDVYDSSGAQATPLETGTDLPQCIERVKPAGFGPGQSFETCDVYLLPPNKAVGRVVLAAEGPNESDLTWTVK